MKLYTLRDLAHSYGARLVLEIPRLEIEPGQITALLGANGAGKTTLLNILAFLEVPSRGEISFAGSPVRLVEQQLLALRRQVVLVDQQPVLFSRSVFKNLEYGLKLRGIGQQERSNRIAEALDLLGMRRFSNLPAANLSGGETQRVALARALVLQPRVLLCDEPIASVDHEHQGVIINLLQQLNKEQGLTVIFTTHDQRLAASIAQQTIQLAHGKLAGGGGDMAPLFDHLPSGKRLQGAGDARHRPAKCTGEHEQADNAADSVPGDRLPENSFPAVLRRDERAQLVAELRSGTMLVLGQEIRGAWAAQSMVCRIDPQHIALVPESGEKPGCNVFKGVILQATLQNMAVHLVVAAADIFAVVMARQQYQERGLLVGQEVNFHLPPEKIELLPSGV